MDKKEASQETQSQKNPDKRKKSASGIWDWILWLLFVSAVIVVFSVSYFGHNIWYALTGKPDPKPDSITVPGPDIRGNPIQNKDIRTSW